ncbi:hypothetical protein ACWD5R_33715 [Streptomyces sp. NPDC002514]|uniref:hypothetical protein n=1 Tax=unclassified Streptomyces TaxID=2593676 RepID=UPI0036AF52F6
MPWTRGTLSALAVCVLLSVGVAGCGTGAAHDGGGAKPSVPAGRLLDKRDDQDRRYREVPEDGAPGVGIEVTPDAVGGWDVRLTVHDFRFSADGATERARTGRGLANLFVDGEQVARLRTPGHHLAARLIPQGTHQITARLYADDGTVWAVHGKAVESTADVTASGAETGSGSGPGSLPAGSPGVGTAPAPTVSPGAPAVGSGAGK